MGKKRDESALYRIMRQIALNIYHLLINQIFFAYKFQSIYDQNNEEKENEFEEFKNSTKENIKYYKRFCDEIWFDVQSINKKAHKITKNEFKILENELKTAGNLKLSECKNDIRFESILKNKIINLSNI